jgi:hypothetical protein
LITATERCSNGGEVGPHLNQLNRAGEDGWEAVSFLPVPADAGMKGGFGWVLLKRQAA